MKRLLLTLLVSSGLYGASVDDLTFTLNDASTAYAVTNCVTSASGSLDIPSTYNGLPVTSIEASAFYGRTSLTSITIPDSVTSIGTHAFNRCSALTSITIGDSVTSIGMQAFYRCTSLSSINIPDSMTSIGMYAFYNCTSLTSITIPDSVTSIALGAFSNCSSLTSITIPDGVTSIADQAFEGTGLSFLEDTHSIKYLLSASGNTAYLIDGSSAFGNVTLPSDVQGGSVTSIADSAFYGRTSLTSITIPDSVTSIGSEAFFGCSALTSITIGDSVTSIGDYAFAYTNLTSVIVPKSVTSIGDSAFGGGEYGYTVNTITLPYKFAGSAGLFGIPGDAEITVNFDGVSEGLLANTNFVTGISEEVTFDSSAVDQAIADEAQARADADVAIQSDVDQNEADSDAADAAIRTEFADADAAIQADIDQNELESDAADAALQVAYADLQQQINDLQTYIDTAIATAVTQARSEGVTAGIQAVTSDPHSYDLYSESSIMEMNVSNPTLSMLNETQQAQVEFTLETSTDLEDWNIEERIQRTIEATGDKFFVRIKSGTPYVTPTVVTFNHPTYGEILTDQDGNVLYGFSIDSVGGDPLYSGSAWPLVSHSTDPEPDADVTAALTRGTYSNTSGGPWLKINNRPVYTYAGDSEPNQASGHGLGSVWFTIKPDGTLNQ